jgi:hypothetical protein
MKHCISYTIKLIPLDKRSKEKYGKRGIMEQQTLTVQKLHS